MDQEAYRHLPYDIDIEQAALGAVLTDNRALERVADTLRPEHFYDPLHQRIYGVMLDGADREKMRLTPLTVHAAMKSDPGLVEVGGHAYLAGLAESAPALPAMREYAQLLIDLAARREVIQISEDALNAAYEAPRTTPTEAIISQVTDGLLSIGQYRRREVSTVGAAAQASIASAERRLAGNDVKSITTGLSRMDKAIGGFQPGDRVGIAARTGMGKSLCASSMALAAARTGAPVLVISADMREQQWANRAVTDMDLHLNPGLEPLRYQKFRTGRFTDGEWERAVLAQQELAALTNYMIDDNPSVNLSYIRSRARTAARQFSGRQGLLVVDFLQKVTASDDGKRDRRRDEDLTDVAYGLGDIVRDLGWTLLVLIQLKNKDSDGKGHLREDPPTVADIRESGGIEMALDIIASPFREMFFHERKEPPGKGYADGPPPEWLAWAAEGREKRHRMRMLGWKLRDGRASDLNLDLWCDPGACAVRDVAPSAADAAIQEMSADLLNGLGTSA